MFAAVAVCRYQRYGRGGGQETKGALCVLSLNMINDKVATRASNEGYPKVRNHGEGSYYATKAFSWLKEAATAFTFKTLLRRYAKRALTPRSLNVKLGPLRKGHKGRAVWLA